MRSLVLVLGDQLTLDNAAFDGFDPAQDRVLMLEAPGEATHVWSHRARIALFLATMRHFAQAVEDRGWPLTYMRTGDSGPADLPGRLAAQLQALQPTRLIVCEPGDYRLLAALQDVTAAARVPLDLRPDRHFMASREDFAQWAGGSRQLRMEFFYRRMRRQHGILMDGDQPLGGRWNFDADNRGAFPKTGPGALPPPPAFAPDALTREVLAEVAARYPQHPGSLADFAWPVTRAQAQAALTAFVHDRLPHFGTYQDAMWTGTPFAWHSLLSSALNLKLLDPREVIAAAVEAGDRAQLPLASVEGFVRQVLGWREFIRGVYWLDMPGLAHANHFGHTRPLPAWYWTADTHMNCMRDTIGQTLRHGYAHHIQRLMVTGNFALLAGMDPQQVCDWYLAVYVDAVDWVERPNTAGMALYANGGRFTSKPYVASGAYIKRMSNYCKGCRYDPAVRAGDQACPFTTLYWNFLDRHEPLFARNPRTALMAKSIGRLSAQERQAIRATADRMLDHADRL
jgi:deoxyribodipyrimidine photolyase-related protein